MAIRGVRGATTVPADEPNLILEATRELLEAILAANKNMNPEDVGSALFTIGEMTGFSLLYPLCMIGQLNRRRNNLERLIFPE